MCPRAVCRDVITRFLSVARLHLSWKYAALLAVLLPSVAVGTAKAVTWTAGDLVSTAAGNPLNGDAGQRPDRLFSRAYLELLIDDTSAILTAPRRWDRRDWMIAGGLTSLVLSSTALDGQIREESQENRTRDLNTLTQNIQRLGAEGSWVVLGVFGAYGEFAGDRRAKAVALDGVTASIIASGLVTPTLKWAVGRTRPNASDRVFDIHPFRGNYSFPSGHATQAFAIAAVVAAHYDRWWVQGLSYGLAGLVAYSRIEQNAHYASDVVGGAVIGTVIGRAIVRRHNSKERAFTVAPYADRHGTGLVVERLF